MTHHEGDRLDLELEEIAEVDVRIVAGEVSVTAGGREATSVRLEVEVLRGPPVGVDVHDGVLVVEHQPLRSITRLLSGEMGVRANVSVIVPEGTETRVRTVSGDVFVGGIRSVTSLTTVSGRITATGLDGEVGLRTVSGDIDVQGVDGTVRANAVSGDVTISGGAPAEVTARAVSGELTLDFDEVPDAVECTTVSGDVAVRLPADADVDLEAVTVSGRLESGYPDVLDSSKRRLSGRIGEGGRRLSVRTTSGDVTVLRRATASADA
ncbi:MAG TPA: DUF4097 family beta strand repeat-containing protein [Acidimicrobiales bacterium]|nr:DUF4097 family beta strand repeat-containing protein [Acidimicrobiales bacterium]